MREGFRTFAVSAMNQTPQNAITSPFGFSRFAGKFQTVADKIGQFLNLGVLIVVREQNRAAIALQIENFFSDSAGGNHEFAYFESVREGRRWL